MGGRILIVDDVATNRIVLKVKLSEACYRSLTASDGAGCLATARAEAPDLILLDHLLPDMSGIEVLRQLRADPATRDIPVVMFSATADVQVRIEALREGADDFLSKPIEDQLLLARLRSLMRDRDAPDDRAARAAVLQALGLQTTGLAEDSAAFEGPGVIALIADRVETAMHWRKDLAPLMSDRVVVLSREQALEDADGSNGPDIFVIEADLGVPGGGLRLMSDLRSRPATRHASVCIVQADAAGGAAIAFDLGANDLVSSTFDPREFRLRLRNLMRRKRSADHQRATVQNGMRLAIVDPLTGLYNRRYGMAHLEQVAESARISGRSFAVMVIDLDRFKTVNDSWGHAAGDAVLIEVARRLNANLRQGDMLARVGGEEFLAVLTETRLAEAQVAADRLCQAMRERPVPLAAGGRLSVTVSIGLAVSDGTPEPIADIVERADRALMLAKSSGRNQVMTSRSDA